MDVTVSPVNIFDENKYVYLYDPVYGVNVFDYYGSLKNNIMIQGWQNFKVVENISMVQNQIPYIVTRSTVSFMMSGKCRSRFLEAGSLVLLPQGYMH